MHKVVLVSLLMAVAAWPTLAERSYQPRELWNQPFHPFHVIGNVYYVGVASISSYLIITPAGSILIDGALKESAPLIAQSIRQLGVPLDQIKYLLSTHAHYDHAGGLAELKRRSGALLVASQADGHGIEVGNRDVPPVAVDQFVGEGDTVALGGTTITAHLTPGHTRGCTTWTMTTTEGNHQYSVVFYCGSSVKAPLIGNRRYPAIVADFEETFRRLHAFSADVFLEMHPSYFNMERKLKRVAPGVPNPFVDPTELERYVNASEHEFQERLARQRAQIASRTKASEPAD